MFRRPPVCMEGGSCSRLRERFPGKGPARALALANPGDPLDVGAVGHTLWLSSSDVRYEICTLNTPKPWTMLNGLWIC